MRDKIGVFSVLAGCLLLLAQCLAQTESPQGSVIHVDVVGLRNNNGQIFCALYASAEGFPKDSQKALRRDSSSISEKKASCEFSATQPGTYAVSVFHDENSNGKLDTNFLGVNADLKRSHFGRSGVSHLAPELASVYTSTPAANR